MSKHTPGPWEIYHPHNDLITSPSGFIAQLRFDTGIPNFRRSIEESGANSHLIAASPETLAELKRLRGVVVEILSHLVCGGTLKPGDVNIDLGLTDAIIAKAEGELK